MINYTGIFSSYYTAEGQPFLNLNKRVVFPSDINNEIYEKYHIQDNTPWTVLSHQLYKTIDYWWVLCSLNHTMVFYAEKGSEILIIKPSIIEEVVSKVY